MLCAREPLPAAINALIEHAALNVDAPFANASRRSKIDMTSLSNFAALIL